MPRTLSHRKCRQLIGALVLILFLAGCQQQPPEPETDEPMKRAQAEAISLDTAADYFTYRSYDVDGGYPGDSPAADKSADQDAARPLPKSYSRVYVHDYFRGMDVTIVDEDRDDYPDQLLDRYLNDNGDAVAESDSDATVTDDVDAFPANADPHGEETADVEDESGADETDTAYDDDTTDAEVIQGAYDVPTAEDRSAGIHRSGSVL